MLRAVVPAKVVHPAHLQKTDSRKIRVLAAKLPFHWA
jgi:hypothetical protein